MTGAALPVRSSEPLPGRLPAALDPWLPRVAPADVAPLNALHRHRRPLEALVAGHTVVIETASRSAVEPGGYGFRLTIGGRPALLRLSADLAQLCARALAIADFARLHGAPAAILFELALLRALKAFEGALRTSIRVLERIEVESTVGLVPLHLAVRGLPAGDAGIDLFLDRQSVPAVADALDAFAAPNAVPLTMPVRIGVGEVLLTLAELRSLRPGDIVLADAAASSLPPLTAAVAGRLVAAVERVEGGFRLTSRPSPADRKGDWPMQQGEALVDKDIDQLPVRVVFELGRLDLPLAEVRRLAPGSVLPLGRTSESAVDLVANGRRIASGSLVKIGEGIGVRIERLGTDDEL